MQYYKKKKNSDLSHIAYQQVETPSEGPELLIRKCKTKTKQNAKKKPRSKRKKKKQNQKPTKKPLDIYILYYEIWSDIYYVCTDVCTTLTLAEEEEQEEDQDEDEDEHMRICLIVNLDRNNHSNIPSKIEHNCFQIRNLTVQTTILMRICAYARYIWYIHTQNICMRIGALFKRNWAFRCHWRGIRERCACTCMRVHVSVRVCLVVDGHKAVEDAPSPKGPIRSSIWVKIYTRDTRHVHTSTRTHTHTQTHANTRAYTH